MLVFKYYQEAKMNLNTTINLIIYIYRNLSSEYKYYKYIKLLILKCELPHK